VPAHLHPGNSTFHTGRVRSLETCRTPMEGGQEGKGRESSMFVDAGDEESATLESGRVAGLTGVLV